jgi:hypothetical protein
MAQAGFTPISLYFSTTAAAVPSAGNLVAGELALNTVDEKLYFKNSAGTVKLLASNATSAPVVSFSAGTTGFTPNTATTGAVTLAGTLATTNGGTGLTSFTSGGVVYASSSSALATGSALTFNGTTPTSSNATGSPNFIFNSSANTPYIRFDQTGASKFTIGESSIVGGGGAGFYDFYAVASVGQRFFTNAAESLRITSAGDFSVNTAITTYSKVNIKSTTSTLYGGVAIYSSNGTESFLGLGCSGSSVGITATYGATGSYLPLVFDIGGSERARIDTAGNVGIGTSSPSNILDVASSNGTNYAASSASLSTPAGGSNAYLTNTANGGFATLKFQSTNSSSAIGYFGFYNTSGSFTGAFVWGQRTGSTSYAEQARISSAGGFSVGTTSDPGAGAIYATGNITAFFSDKRLKTVSGKIENALDKVAKLSGVYYTFNDTAKSFGYDSDEEHVGVIAQEVESVLPQIVKAAPFDLDENNNSKSGENYKTVQYDKLVPLLIEAINELQAKVKALEAK